MTAVDSEIDSFIRQQKVKLANERQNLNLLEPTHYYRGNARRRWGPPVDLDTLKTAEKENYKRTWYELKGKYLEPSSSRKQTEFTMKLSPRGVLDTNALILDVQKEKEREEYQERWRQHHGGQEPSSRNPINRAPVNRAGGGPSDPRTGAGLISPRTQKQLERENYKQLWQQQHPEGRGYRPAQNIGMNKGGLDTDQIIQEVQREKMEEEEFMRTQNAVFGGGRQAVSIPGRGQNTRKVEGEKGIGTDAYRKRWEQQNSKREQGTTQSAKPAAGAKLDTDALIAEVTKDKSEEEYKQMLEDRQSLQAAKKLMVSGVHKQDGSLFDESQQNIENKISEAKHEADDYRKRWEAQHAKRSESQRPRYQNNGFLIEEDGRLEKVKHLREERKREYNDYLASQRRIPTRERYDLTPEFDESEEFGLFHNLGMEDKKKQRKREPASQLNLPVQTFYEDIQRGVIQRLPLREQTDEYKVSALGGNDSDAVKLQKIKERNEEYNQFLMAKNEDKNRFTDKKPTEESGIYATIPGLRYSTSAQRKELAAERNREYNTMLRHQVQNKNNRGVDAPFAGPKQGWSTPTYEEVLDQKRAQESNYRRANDTIYETNLHALEDDIQAETVMSKPSDLSIKNYHDTVTRGPSLEFGSTGRHGIGQHESQYVGAQVSDTNLEKQKRKEEYKRDLQQQIAETAFARRKEKEAGILVNDASIAKPEPLHVIYGGRETSRKDPSVEAYHTKILESLHKLDEISPQTNAILGRGQSTGDRKSFGGLHLNLNSNSNPIQQVQMDRQAGGILDLGFGPVLEPARLVSLDPPAGLQYQPSTYITANAVSNMNSSVDEAYNFYASHNPLDPFLGVAPSGVGRGGGGAELGGDVPVPSLDLSRVGRDGGPTSRVHFKDSRPQEAPAAGMNFTSNEERKQNQRQQQSVYREELERQMLEKNIKKLRDKDAQEKYDLKMEVEAKNFDPFGKGGGGAPMRDQSGNVISDLRQMRHDNVNRDNKLTPRGYKGGSVGHAGNTTRGAASYRDDLIGPPPAQMTAEGETSFARGGHGIFGMPKTDAEKMQADRYKIELKRQMEEKRAEEYRKKQLEKLEDERHQKILDEQRAKIQREFEEEQRKIREKEEEARRRNEDMIRAAEEKKREIERRKREAEEQRQQELREERDREVRERQREEEVQSRGKSPVIPTLRSKQNVKQDYNKMTDSPPVPATRTRTAVDLDTLPFTQEYIPRTHSADVLNQLAHMRAQLQNERRRVQTMLNDQEDDVEIFDPRTAQMPPPMPVSLPKPELDVFKTAMNRNAVAVRRTPADRVNPQAVEDFDALKHKDNSDSRKQFRHMFPEKPDTDEALETQQAALLRQQEERLHNFRDRRPYDDKSPLQLIRDIHSSSSQLHSKSAFVDMNGMGHFPDDFEDIPGRNESARSRRRTRVSSSPRFTSPGSGSAFGSQTSLNVDKLARKNEDRLKKLRDMQGDDLSLYDPEDVLDRFMSKQGHNRPPSGNTLLDDTWMKTGNKIPKY